MNKQYGIYSTVQAKTGPKAEGGIAITGYTVGTLKCFKTGFDSVKKAEEYLDENAPEYQFDFVILPVYNK